MRYFVQLSYLGTYYHGWQIQPNANSVQQTLNEALSTLLRSDVYAVGAGRTDTGVHAKEMFAHFDCVQALDMDQVTYKLNRLLPPDIAVQRMIKVADEAHARFDAVERSYAYHLTFAKDPFTRHLALQYTLPLDLEQMQQAAALLPDFEDFGAFARSHTQTHTHLCRVTEAYWETREGGAVFHISANRFLRNMVRAIVGTLLEVGVGKRSVADFKHVIEQKDRKLAGESAAAHGLFLTRVKYPNAIIHV